MNSTDSMENTIVFTGVIAPKIKSGISKSDNQSYILFYVKNTEQNCRAHIKLFGLTPERQGEFLKKYASGDLIKVAGRPRAEAVADKSGKIFGEIVIYPSNIKLIQKHAAVTEFTHQDVVFE